MQQLGHIDLVSPGTAGLNLQQRGSILPPIWATLAQNCIIDDSGRLAARNGYSVTTTTPISGTPNVKTLFEYIQGDGTVEPIVAWDGGIANDLTDPSGNDISGAVTDTNGHWWFQNFNEKVIGFQDGQKPIVRPSASNFATVVESSGTAPTIEDNVGLCAYGRAWGLDSDGQTIKYSGLLHETDWGRAGAGSIDMSNVWTGGMDKVTAIAAFNGSLVSSALITLSSGMTLLDPNLASARLSSWLSMSSRERDASTKRPSSTSESQTSSSCHATGYSPSDE